VDYVYDLVGKIQQVSDPTGTYGFAYDNMGRLIGTTTQHSFLPGFNFQNGYTYDSASNRKTLTAPDGSTNTYNYDTLNRLSTLTNSLTGQFGFGYDALSRRTQLTRPNGINTNYTYDSLSRLLSVLHQAGSTTLDGASYGYDFAGNRTSKTNYLNNVTEGYTYDPIYQLTQVAQGASTTESYSYDAVGNRLSSVGVNPYSYNASNQLTATPSGSYTYDNNGNTLTDASGKSYTWDFENRLASAVLPGTGTVTFKYDPFGRRVQKSSPLGTTNYLYDGASVTEDLDNSGSILARYTQGLAVDEPLSESRLSTTSYYHQDGLGSVSSLSSSAGTLAKTYNYDAYGKLTASTGTLTNPFQYTGREVDSESGIYYYRARYYDSQIGRFISEDPFHFGGGGPNFFSYVNNNPIVGYDPFGLRTKCILAGAVGQRILVCWDDGNGNGDDSVQILGRPNGPPSIQSTNAAGIAADFDAFSDCANHITTKCNLPSPPKGNPFNPPKGPKGDMGVTPNEGSVSIPQFNDPLAHNCDCLKQHPLAALDPRFHFEYGNQNYGISPGCMVSVP
jgi:RHS repeat-associated protein